MTLGNIVFLPPTTAAQKKVIQASRDQKQGSSKEKSLRHFLSVEDEKTLNRFSNHFVLQQSGSLFFGGLVALRVKETLWMKSLGGSKYLKGSVLGLAGLAPYLVCHFLFLRSRKVKKQELISRFDQFVADESIIPTSSTRFSYMSELFHIPPRQL